jgi:hypothetical protein
MTSTKLLSAKEIAFLFDISEKAVKEMAKAHDIPHLENRLKFDITQIFSWLDTSEAQARTLAA